MPESPRKLEVQTRGGRRLEALVDDASAGLPLVFHHGTPSAAVWSVSLAEASRRAGLRLVLYSRPGYGSSTPQPGRTVASAAQDVADLLNELKAETFIAIGWSGGGPHALACAAFLPDRCRAAVTIAGVAPYSAQGLDWLGAMAPENVEEFGAAARGEAVLTPMLEKWAEGLRKVQGPEVAASLGGLVTAVDKQALTGEFADELAASFRYAVSNGVAGWRDDDLAFTRDWGFPVESIRGPVSVWQGAEDRMVPFSHGQWLASHIPGVSVNLHPEEGHISLRTNYLDAILNDAVRLAGMVVSTGG
jgi:pimeloyl-ACP methyl ester carboxylesterase